MRAIRSDERFDGERVTLRLLTLDDCTSAYVGWLQDPEVNQYLETRWSPQTFETVRDFIGSMVDSPHSYLFAILDRSDHKHVGNIKVGPINSKHLHADVSYFIGERDRWGRGLATDAIKVITRLAFERLGLHRVQAGVYGANQSSCRALERAGYTFEGNFRCQLRSGDRWDDHLWYGLVKG